MLVHLSDTRSVGPHAWLCSGCAPRKSNGAPKPSQASAKRLQDMNLCVANLADSSRTPQTKLGVSQKLVGTPKALPSVLAITAGTSGLLQKALIKTGTAC